MRGEDLLEYTVYDGTGARIGTIENVWTDTATGEPEFYGIKTGWILGRTHVVPATDVRLDESGRGLHLPYDKDRVKAAPTLSPNDEISAPEEQRVYAHFGIPRTTRESPSGLPGGAGGAGIGGVERGAGLGVAEDEARMRLSEEELNVGKRTVESGGARLRKVVRTEHVEEPVELRREEVHVERTPATGIGEVPPNAFQEEEINVTATREEPVVEKTARVTGEVRAYKTAETERRTVGGEVRKEDVEIDRDRDREPRRLARDE